MLYPENYKEYRTAVRNHKSRWDTWTPNSIHNICFIFYIFSSSIWPI